MTRSQRYSELARMSKAILARKVSGEIVNRTTGRISTLAYSEHPPLAWSKDELVSDVLDREGYASPDMGSLAGGVSR